MPLFGATVFKLSLLKIQFISKLSTANVLSISEAIRRAMIDLQKLSDYMHWV